MWYAKNIQKYKVLSHLEEIDWLLMSIPIGIGKCHETEVELF